MKNQCEELKECKGDSIVSVCNPEASNIETLRGTKVDVHDTLPMDDELRKGKVPADRFEQGYIEDLKVIDYRHKLTKMIFAVLVVCGLFITCKFIFKGRLNHFGTNLKGVTVRDMFGNQYLITGQHIRPDKDSSSTSLLYKGGNLYEISEVMSNSSKYIDSLKINPERTKVDVVNRLELGDSFHPIGVIPDVLDSDRILLIDLAGSKIKSISMGQYPWEVKDIEDYPNDQPLMAATGIVSLESTEPPAVIISEGTPFIRLLNIQTATEIDSQQRIMSKSNKPVEIGIGQIVKVEDYYLCVNTMIRNEILLIDIEKKVLLTRIDLIYLHQTVRRYQNKNKLDQQIKIEDGISSIAYNSDTGEVYIGGKHWPLMFSLKFKKNLFERNP